MIRRARPEDIPEVVKIYDHIHDKEEAGESAIGWVRDIYPTVRTAITALEQEDLFVGEVDGRIVSAARINQQQVPEYADCRWEYDAPEDQVMVLHTLVVEPSQSGKGYGKEFIRFYEDYALRHGCVYLRLDTNEINTAARTLYKKLGYKEPGIVPCVFNGIEGVRLVCLEKKLSSRGKQAGHMRRKDREISDIGEILNILDKCTVMRLGMSDNGAPYIVPLNFGCILEDGRLFFCFHSAPEGRKADILRADPNVFFEADRLIGITGGDMPCQWSCDYESVTGSGVVTFLTEGAERKKALDAIMAKYGFEGVPHYDGAAFAHTLVYRLEVKQIVGKRHASRG